MSQLRRLQQALMLGLAMMLMACGRDALTAPRAVAPTVRYLRWATQLADTLFGPHEFERGLGRPKADTAHFAAPDRETVSFSFTSSNRQGLAGTVELDGAILFTITDTTTLPAVRQAVAQPSATLVVRLGGKPGSRLTVVATVPTPLTSAPWWNAYLDFNGGSLPTGWQTRLLGGSNPGLVNDRLESYPVDDGPWVTSAGKAPVNLLGIVIQYDGQNTQSYWGNGQAVDLWIGDTRNAIGRVNATYNFGTGNEYYFAHQLLATPVYRGATVPFIAGDHRYRIVVRQDSVLWTSRLRNTNEADTPVAIASPSWDLRMIDSVGLRAQASDVAAWMDNVRIRAITDYSTTATLDILPAIVTLSVGQQAVLAFDARNINGQPLAGKSPVWSSSDGTVVEVSASGAIIAVGPGHATISAMVDGAVGYAVVTVPAPAAPYVAILQASAKYTPDLGGLTATGETWTGDPAKAVDGFESRSYDSWVRLADAHQGQSWQTDLGAVAQLSEVRMLWWHTEEMNWKQRQIRGSTAGVSWTTVVGTRSVPANATWAESPVSGG